MSENLVKIALVIPVYNRRETTLQGLRSLSRIDKTGLDVRVIIVNDGSTDGTSEAVRRDFPDVQLVEADGSLHYAGGTNRGIEAAMEWGADYVGTMNDDSIFHDQFLQRMLRAAEKNPRSVIGALLLLWNEPHKVFQVGQVWETFFGGWHIPTELTAFSVPNATFEVDCLVGNCTLIPAEAIRECGLMDEVRFRHGWGDAQYFWAMRKAGWKLLIEPKALVWCEPNTYPPPLQTLTLGKRIKVLFFDQRHPLNLKRQFDARWYARPSAPQALVAFGIYLLKISMKGLKLGDPWENWGDPKQNWLTNGQAEDTGK